MIFTTKRVPATPSRSVSWCLTVAAGALGLAAIHPVFAEPPEAVVRPERPNAQQVAQGPLNQYVQKADTSYRWSERHAGMIGGARYAELIMTSQTWKDIAWKHQLFLIKPASMKGASTKGATSHALLFITGGNWRDELEQPSDDGELPREAQLFAQLAEVLQTPVAVLLHVPQQPLFEGRREDAIIALTFQKYFETQDPEWPLLLPMVKSAVRAMDTVQTYARDQWSLPVETFTVTGASKRGWTTWLTGAVDSRVTAIAPMVIDMLNMDAQMDHQVRTWGKPSYKVNDYTRLNLHKHSKTPTGRKLLSIVDPFAYRSVLQQPKLIILGTNDHYWPLDALNLYWSELIGPKYILYVPNNRHGLKDLGRLAGSLTALHRAVVQKEPLPEMKWEFSERDGKLRVSVVSDQKPSEVRAWTATARTRDFRSAEWSSRRCETTATGYAYELEVPVEGYVALFAEAVYGERAPFFLSTNMHVVPGLPAAAAE